MVISSLLHLVLFSLDFTRVHVLLKIKILPTSLIRDNPLFIQFEFYTFSQSVMESSLSQDPSKVLYIGCLMMYRLTCYYYCCKEVVI